MRWSAGCAGGDLWLLGGPIVSASGAFDALGADGPSTWWPEDQAWCVATELDFRWTYVGGSLPLIRQIVDDARFEALPAAISDQVTIFGDRVNR